MNYYGFKGMIKFLNMLDEKGVRYAMDYKRDGAVLIRATLVGVRLEVEIFEDRFEFSAFTGDESISSDVDVLHRLISENWS